MYYKTVKIFRINRFICQMYLIIVILWATQYVRLIGGYGWLHSWYTKINGENMEEENQSESITTNIKKKMYLEILKRDYCCAWQWTRANRNITEQTKRNV